ncbi:ribonucleoside-diphosphate reductase [Elysia marginata]|uniref:Ribonucleoside-diphosphate reductase n=1 Tax=Elysia marginata TaxID=1093978 RepID=A0AAV4FQG1_9GAST|nr:ribonucleoside-diphosphate reductase [Elysia marginata]
MKITNEGISRMVMLDRYSQKDRKLETLTPGDLVVAKIKHDPKFPTLGIGYVKDILSDAVTLEIEDEYVGQIDPSLNPEGNVLRLPKSSITKPMEIFYEQIAKRVGHYLASDEDQKYAKEFSDEIGAMNIVPAGRVLYGAGSGTNVTYFNCFVMPMPHDSRGGLADHRKEVMEIMSRGGGVGTNGSTLRPKNSAAVSVGGTSSGAVS